MMTVSKRKIWMIGSLALVLLSLMVSPLVATETWWTGWYDRDDPSVTGDWENRSGHGDVCSGNTIIGMEAQTLGGTPSSQTGEIFFIDSIDGLVCRKADQPDNACLDYRVRYHCKGDLVL